MKNTWSGFLLYFLLVGNSILMAQAPDRKNYDFRALTVTESKDKALLNKSTWSPWFAKRIYYEIVGEELKRYSINHYVTAVTDDKGVEENNKIRLPLYSNNLVDVKVRVVKDGQILAKHSASDFKKVKEEEVELQLLAVSSLTKGCLIEVIIHTEEDNDTYDNTSLQFSEEVGQMNFSLVIPEMLKFDVQLYNAQASLKDTLVGGNRHYLYQLSNVPAFESEEYSAKSANRIRVEYNFAENINNGKKSMRYPEIGRILFDRLIGDFSSYQSDLKKLIKKANKGGTEKERILAIEHFLKTNIVVKNEGKVDDEIKAIIKNKFCSRYGFNRLLTAAYIASEIPVEVVITCDRFSKVFDKNFHSWSYMNNLMLYFPGIQAYVEPGSIVSRIGYAGNEYLGQNALHIKPVALGEQYSGVTSFKMVPVPDIEQNNDKMVLNVSIEPERNMAKINYHREMSNFAEMGLRGVYYLAGQTSQKDFFYDFVKNTGSGCGVVRLEASNYNLGDVNEMAKPFVIDADLSCQDYLEKAGDNLILKVGELIGKQSELYEDKDRKYDIVLQYPHAYERIIRVKIPKGFRPKGLEKLVMKDEYTDDKGRKLFGFTNSWKQDGDELILTGTEYYQGIFYPKSRYAEFRKVINDAADFNKLVIVFEKLP